MPEAEAFAVHLEDVDVMRYPIEERAERSKIMLAKQGASTHAPSAPIAQTWKLPFARSIASMLIRVVIDVPSIRF